MVPLYALISLTKFLTSWSTPLISRKAGFRLAFDLSKYAIESIEFMKTMNFRFPLNNPFQNFTGKSLSLRKTSFDMLMKLSIPFLSRWEWSIRNGFDNALQNSRFRFDTVPAKKTFSHSYTRSRSLWRLSQTNGKLVYLRTLGLNLFAECKYWKSEFRAKQIPTRFGESNSVLKVGGCF